MGPYTLYVRLLAFLGPVRKGELRREFQGALEEFDASVGAELGASSRPLVGPTWEETLDAAAGFVFDHLKRDERELLAVLRAEAEGAA